MIATGLRKSEPNKQKWKEGQKKKGCGEIETEELVRRRAPRKGK
jgi:hypothetical protein